MLGLNLLVGYSGQISLGHGAFFALGAYTCAILLDRTGIHYLLTIPAAGLVCFAAGLALGLPALRLRGLYLALVTLAIAIATPVLIRRFDGLTGGSQGLAVEQPTAPAWSGLADDQFLYFLALVVAAPLFWFAAGLVRRDVGRALIAMRDDETAAQDDGREPGRLQDARVRAQRRRTRASRARCSCSTNGFVAPESFTLVVSFSFLAAVVVGGLATVAGALFGALFIVFVPVWSSDVNDALSGVIYGAALIACMYVFRSGIMGLLRSAFARLVEVKGSTNGRTDDEVDEVAVADPDRRAGAGAGGVRP